MKTVLRKSWGWFVLSAWVGGAQLWMGCGSDESESMASEPADLSFEKFKSTLPLTSDGEYIVEGDVPIYDLVELENYYNQTVAYSNTRWPIAWVAPDGETQLASRRDGLVSAGGRWTDGEKLSIRYCISSSLPLKCDQDKAEAIYDEVKNAMNAATCEWEQSADVRFVHVEALDGNCTKATEVEFNVKVVCENAAFAAMAFQPNSARASRVLTINWPQRETQAAPTLEQLLLHEVGHALGFVHEHSRTDIPAQFLSCKNLEEVNGILALTGYDFLSVMHQRRNKDCDNVKFGVKPYALTDKDRAGAAALYSPASNPRQCPVK